MTVAALEFVESRSEVVPRLRIMVSRPGSGMDLMLDRFGEDPDFRRLVRVVVATCDGSDVGWGALCPPIWPHGLMVHVLKPHRRAGVGTAIVEALLPASKDPPMVFSGTTLACEFWNNFRDRIRRPGDGSF